MALDPRLSLFAGQGVTPVRDPMQTMAGAYQLQSQQQQNQAAALQLAEAQRQEQERGTLAQAFRQNVVTDPTTGQKRLDVPGAFSTAYGMTTDPLTVFKAEQGYLKSQADVRKDQAAAQKDLLEQRMKGLELVGNVANGVLAAVDGGADPQAAYQQGIATVAQFLGPDMLKGLPPTFDRGTVTGFAAQSKYYYDQLKAEHDALSRGIRERELVETQKRTQLQEDELGVRREDIQERREGRQQERESKAGERRFDKERELGKEFTSLTKDYRTVADAYGRIQSAEESGPGDISLIFSYMKLLDPGSTVREGEFATAQNAGGVPDRIIALYNRLKSGERLAPEVRKQFVEQAQSLYTQATKDYDRTTGHYRGLAEQYGLDPNRVTQEFGSTATPRTSGTTGKTMSEADIAEAMRQTKKTRQEILEAARAKGWTVPEQ